MKLRLNRSNGVLALSDQLRGHTRRWHKYSVQEDHRRTSPTWSAHGDATDLSKVAVKHVQTAHFYEGRVTRTEWDEPAHARRFLLDAGVAVVDEDGNTHQEPTPSINPTVQTGGIPL